MAPTTTPERIAEIGADARGFVYTVSLTGTTGERSELPPGLADTVSRVRAATEVPVAVGFGISTPEQARSVAEIADGVIVGSRVVRAAGEGGARGCRGSWWASSRAALRDHRRVRASRRVRIVEQSTAAWLVFMSSPLPFSSAPPAPLRLSGLRSSRWRSGTARIAIGAVLLVAIALASGRFQLGGADRRLVLLSGLCVAAYQATFFAAVDDTGVAVGTVVAIGSAPVFTGLMARAFTGERLSGRWAAATALGCAGVCTLVLGGGSGGEVVTARGGARAARGRGLRRLRRGRKDA